MENIKRGICQIYSQAENGFNYLNVARNRRINSCWECRQKALDWLEKECIVCKIWLFGAKEKFIKTCSLECEQKYQKILERQRIIRGEFLRDKEITS